jgi:putative nucleotidyltransferase with HDIG domain
MISAGFLQEAPRLFIPLVLCSLCRSFPITVRENESLDLTVICTLAVYLTQGAVAAVCIFMLSAFFTFEPDEDEKKYHHLFKIGMMKVLFNNSTVIFSILLPDLIIRSFGIWAPGDLSMPMALLPTALFSILTFVVNALLQLFMFYLNGMLPPAEMLHMLLGLTPNVIAAMPMGLLMAYGYASDTFIWFVFLMLFPLMLARFAWKLYIKSENARAKLIKAFINTIEAKDKYTQGHSERVAAYSVQIAKAMNLSRRQIDLIQQGAVLHDIGKIGMPDAILNKPGKLDPEEMAVIQQHPLIGVKVLEEVDLEPEVIEMVRSHHERMDGKGYPGGLNAAECPLSVRILCVADAYDATTSDRPYRKGMAYETVRKILLECKGTQFDPDVVDIFIKSMDGES